MQDKSIISMGSFEPILGTKNNDGVCCDNTKLDFSMDLSKYSENRDIDLLLEGLPKDLSLSQEVLQTGTPEDCPLSKLKIVITDGKLQLSLQMKN